MAAIGEAARRSGVHVETIRYYERSGVVPSPARRANGQRDYAEDDIRRLSMIRRCRDMEFTLSDARHLSELTVNAHTNCPEARAIAQTHLETVRAHMSRLRAIEAELAALVEDCVRRVPSCPVLKKLGEEEPDRTP